MGKYFKYAIGEILLVVFGILIALQINNWNESRRRATLKETYLSRLMNDVGLDTLHINQVVGSLEHNQESIQAFIAELGGNANDGQLDKAATVFFDSGWIIYNFLPTNNTFSVS